MGIVYDSNGDSIFHIICGGLYGDVAVGASGGSHRTAARIHHGDTRHYRGEYDHVVVGVRLYGNAADDMGNWMRSRWVDHSV